MIRPEVIASPPKDLNHAKLVFFNLRSVADIDHLLWNSGVRVEHNFITEPKIHATEKRCYTLRGPRTEYLIGSRSKPRPPTLRPLESYIVETLRAGMMSDHYACRLDSCGNC